MASREYRSYAVKSQHANIAKWKFAKKLTQQVVSVKLSMLYE